MHRRVRTQVIARSFAMSDGDAGRWELWRQDNNGNRFLIGRFDSAAAAAEQRRFEALGHKQTYWVQAAAAAVEAADDRTSSDGSGARHGATG